ncbi:hypothetical protein [Bacilliculturomica massiliensis]|uniref:hypothetical protein n=1 Tax=Bacilliculturomica massiliensis TaxID=1917867 RepID=UPI001032337D|nr:hypothetical protein [Bacilliculturomica massiliensis]
MKKKYLVSIIISIIMVLSMGIPAFAGEESMTLEQQELYQKYERIVEEVTKEYGLDYIKLQPISEFQDDYFVSVEEFEKNLRQGCEDSLTISLEEDEEDVEHPSSNPRSAAVKEAENTELKSRYGLGIVFSVTYEITTGGNKYVFNQFTANKAYQKTYNATAYAATISPIYPTISTIDGGRTKEMATQVTITKQGVNYGKYGLSAYFTISSAGKIQVSF